MDDSIVINVGHISKKFCRYIRRSMLYGMQDIGRNLLGMGTKSDKLRKDEFWAVNDVSFELRRGETLGIIGPNGSGKSTILRMLNGIFMPDKGKIEVKGRVGALIDVGAGLHPMLTGRENIYMAGAIRGMSKKEMDEKFDDIVAFAGLGEFLGMPVKNYSSGMLARLGFSTAAHIDPDILLVDEVLAVGDIKFQNKALERMMKIKQNASVVFVSHNLAAVSLICDKVLWLDNGKIRKYGESQEVISEYSVVSMQEVLTERKSNITDKNRTISGDLYIDKIELTDGSGNLKDIFNYGDELVVKCHYDAQKDLGGLFFWIDVASPRIGAVFDACMISDGTPREQISKGKGIVECRFEKIPLKAGIYYIDINVIPETGTGKIYRQIMAKQFEIRRTRKIAKLSWQDLSGGVVEVPHQWKYD